MLARQHPFTHSLVSAGLGNYGRGGFSPIIDSIHELLNAPNLSVSNVFRRLSLLSIRYARSQTTKSLDLWPGLFSVDFTFLDKISSIEPRKLAELMTDEHTMFFTALCDDGGPKPGHLEELYERGRWLSDSVRECALTDDSLATRLVKIAKVSHVASM